MRRLTFATCEQEMRQKEVRGFLDRKCLRDADSDPGEKKLVAAVLSKYTESTNSCESIHVESEIFCDLAIMCVYVWAM